MSKENKKAGSGEKKGTLGRWFSRLFFPNKEMDIYAEEALQSPARMVAKSFFSKPLAVISLVLLILIMLFVFIAPSFVVLDLGEQDSTLVNVSPGYSMMDYPEELENEGIADISVGSNFSAGVDMNGNVYVWGKTKVSRVIDVADVPKEVQKAKITQIAAGFDHIVAVDDKGTVYCWGNARLGQTKLPQELSENNRFHNFKITKVFASHQFSAALTDDNRLLLWGNAYAQIIRNGKGEVIALYPLMPNKMTVDRDENGHLYYAYRRSTDEALKNEGTVILRPKDVLHIPGLGFDGLVGYSPIAMAKNAIGLAIATEEFGAKFFANGAAPSGVLEHPGTIKDPSKVREAWMGQFGGSSNAGKVAVLEEGMKYTPISIAPEQAQFLETRKFQINEIARIFRVPPHMLADLEKSSFSNIEQQSLEFVKYTLDPWVIRWEQSMMRALLTDEEKKTLFVKFNVEGLLRGDYASRMSGYATARQNGWMSANDIRELENLDRIPPEEGGDLYLINGNMLPMRNAGAFADTQSNDGKEEKTDEEILEMEESSADGNGIGGENAVSERHNRRGKLV